MICTGTNLSLNFTIRIEFLEILKCIVTAIELGEVTGYIGARGGAVG
jgi:hypothetical protein